MRYKEATEIPEGTKVVSKVNKIDDNGWLWKSGAVGIVVQGPARHDGEYRVEMNNRMQVLYKRGELAVQRLGVRVKLQVSPEEFDPIPYLAMLSVTGSQAYGLATEESDIDLKGVYVLPFDMHAGIISYPDEKQVHYDAEEPLKYDPQRPLTDYVGGNVDYAFYEIEKFCRLALEANPTKLEMLWSPINQAITPVGEMLIANRDAFISRNMEEKFSGYAQSQFGKLRKEYERTGDYRRCHAVHLIRLLLSAKHLVETGNPLLDVGPHRELLLSIKRGDIDLAKTTEIADDLIEEFNRAAQLSTLPEQPDYKRVQDIIVTARRMEAEKVVIGREQTTKTFRRVL